MKVVIRKYSGQGASRLIDTIEENAADVKSVIGSVKGLVSYTLVRTADGGFTVTVCEDQAGIDESTRRAKEWIAENAGEIGAAAPEVSSGDVVLRLG
jgi:hypothetical protein